MVTPLICLSLNRCLVFFQYIQIVKIVYTHSIVPDFSEPGPKLIIVNSSISNCYKDNVKSLTDSTLSRHGI